MDESRAAANRILLHCARHQADTKGELRSLLPAGVDWAYLHDQALEHNLLPLLYKRLRRAGGGLVPAEVMVRLEGRYYDNLGRNVRLLHELGQIITALHEIGAEAIVLKGGALAGTVYADPGLRPMSDLDLLVRAEQVEAASRVLEAMGFRRSETLPAHLLPFQQRIGGGVEWRRGPRGNATLVDVQHDLVGVDWCRGAFRVESEALWAAARPLALEGAQAWQLSPKDMLLHLCLHAAVQHGYAIPLSGYVDIDRLVHGCGTASFWAGVVDRAARFGVRTMTGYGLRAARDLLGTPVPGEVLRALGPGPGRARVLRWLAAMDPETVLQGVARQPSGLRQALLFLALADDAAGTAAIVRDAAFPSGEWLATRYEPEGGRPVWRLRLAHPFRVARALVRSTRRPLVRSGLD